MTNCSDMKLGEIYACNECGIELEVVKECKDAGLPPDQCVCNPCTIKCCGEELVKK
jgi:hypothetical protein